VEQVFNLFGSESETHRLENLCHIARVSGAFLPHGQGPGMAPILGLCGSPRKALRKWNRFSTRSVL